MSRHLTRMLHAAAAASLVITTMGISGASAASAASAAPQSVGPPGYNGGWSGYSVSGRWFRYASTTMTVPPRTLSAANSGAAILQLQWAHQNGIPSAGFIVEPGGGPGTVSVTSHPGNSQVLRLSPKVGDRLTVSIYYDQKGHDYFTATDLTQHTTQTVQTTVGNVDYDSAFVGAVAAGTVDPPQADTQLWHFASSHMTTYAGDRGTLLGPWITSTTIATTTGTAAGTVKLSPSALSNGGQDFGVWTRALPRDYTTGFAGYGDTGRSFRYVATTLIVPPRLAATANGSLAYIELAHNGGPTPRPYAYIRVQSGGGAGSVGYDCLYLGGTANTLAISPRAGDRLAISVYYDQHGHVTFTATDLTQGTSATVTKAAQLAATSPYNSAGVFTYTSQVTPPAADTALWSFSGSAVTTYTGDRGSILGPWATRQQIGTTTGTAAGNVVVDTPALSNGGRAFTVLLRRAVPDRPMPGVTLGVTAQGNLWTELFYTGTSGQAWRVHMSNMAQDVPESWGGTLVGGPAVVWIPPGTFPISGFAVFGRGTDNRLWWRHETSSGWSAWESLGGVLTSKPTVHLGSALAPGALTVFVRGDNGAVWGGALHGTGQAGALEWTGWVSLGGQLLAGTGPASVGNASGAFVVAVGTNRVVYVAERLVGSQRWTWRPIGGKTTADPGIASPSPNAVVAFVRGTDNALWYNEFFGHTSGVTAGWHSMGGQLTSGIAALTQQEAGVYWRTSVFALGTDSRPWYRIGSWPALSAWAPVRIDY